MYRECGTSGKLSGRPGHVSSQNLSDPFWRGRWCDRDWYVAALLFVALRTVPGRPALASELIENEPSVACILSDRRGRSVPVSESVSG